MSWSYQIYIPPAAAGTACARQHANHGCPSAATANCNMKAVNSTQYTGITIGESPYGGGTSTSFDFRRGGATLAGRTRFDSTNYKIKVVVAPVGRIRICNIAGTSGLGGYEEC